MIIKSFWLCRLELSFQGLLQPLSCCFYIKISFNQTRLVLIVPDVLLTRDVPELLDMSSVKNSQLAVFIITAPFKTQLIIDYFAFNSLPALPVVIFVCKQPKHCCKQKNTKWIVEDWNPPITAYMYERDQPFDPGKLTLFSAQQFCYSDWQQWKSQLLVWPWTSEFTCY